jgi:DnaJ like chaperone protein
MTIWGKVVGSTMGFVVGGPLGALIGGVAGHAVDKLRGKPEDDDATKQIAFTIGVIVLGAKMAKADGQVTSEEVRAFREVFHVPQEEMKNVGRVFDRARKDSSGYEPYARQIAEMFKGQPAVLEDLLDGLFHIASADHIIHPAELNFLEGVAQIFGFSKADWSRIRETYVGPDEADPYRILGVDHNISDTDLKRAYRKLAKEHHPDVLLGQGMPREFVDVASVKLAAINAAYERIARERGIS